jgi:hypothetical protein
MLSLNSMRLKVAAGRTLNQENKYHSVNSFAHERTKSGLRHNSTAAEARLKMKQDDGQRGQNKGMVNTSRCTPVMYIG